MLINHVLGSGSLAFFDLMRPNYCLLLLLFFGLRAHSLEALLRNRLLRPCRKG